MKKYITVIFYICSILISRSQITEGSNYHVDNKKKPQYVNIEEIKTIDVSSSFLLNGRWVKAVPIANGCGTENGIGKLLGRTGAAIDAAINTNSEWLKVIPFPVQVPALAASAATQVFLNTEEYQRINNEVCGEHDVHYHNGDLKNEADHNLIKGGAMISGLAVILSGSPYVGAIFNGSNEAYLEAQKEAEISRKLEEEAVLQGKRLPPGYYLREDVSSATSNHTQEEGGHNLSAIVNVIFLFDNTITNGEYKAIEDDRFVYVWLNPSDLKSINKDFVKNVSFIKSRAGIIDGKSHPIRAREEVITRERNNRGL